MTRTMHTHDDVNATIDRLTLASLWRDEAPDGPAPGPARFKRIVVASDGSEAASYALDWAIKIARAEEAQIHVVSCVAPPPYAFDERISDYAAPAMGSLVTYQALVKQEQEGADELVGRIEARLKEEGIPATKEVAFGFPARAIVHAVEANDADLVVVGSHEHGLLGYLFVSDTTDTVRKRSPCHVLVANGPADAERVVVPVDGSDAGRNAAYTGQDLARRLGHDLLFLHVFPRPMFADEDRARRLYDEAALEWAQETGADPDAPTPIPGKLRFGTSVREIVDEAHDPASLIVMGTRGLTGAKARLLGSVSHAVVHAAPSAVLLVRDHRQDHE